MFIIEAEPNFIDDPRVDMPPVKMDYLIVFANDKYLMMMVIHIELEKIV